MKKILLILALVLILVPGTALAEGITFLFGFQSVSFRGDIGKYYDISPGVGPAAILHLDLGIPLDIRAGLRRTDESGTGRSVKYQWVELGPRFRFGQEDATIRPDIFVGVGSYDLEIGDITFDTATGGYAGFGVEETVSERFVGRFEAKAVYWESSTYNNDAPSMNMSLLFGFKF